MRTALTLGAAALAICGCAKFPASGSPQNTHVIFTIRVAGHIRTGMDSLEPTPWFYVVALNPSTDPNPTVQGPIPVIAPPWGNGILAGTATHYVQYQGIGQTFPYTLYQFTAPDQLVSVPIGAPLNTIDPGTNGNTLQFEIDLGQLSTTPDQLHSLQVNILTMDRKPQGNDNVTKIWDALGDSRNPNEINDFIKISLDTSHVYTNNDLILGAEVTGDTVDPNLDVVDWTIEVRKP